jgi:hypothetical protein
MMRRLIAGTINRYPAEEGWEHVHLDKSGRRLHDLARRATGAPAEIIGDLVDLPELVDAGSFDEVRCWQVLEHLTPQDAPRAIAGFRHALRPGGVLDIEVPNIELLIRQYTRGELAWEDLLGNLYGQSWPRMVDEHLNAHRWGWSEDSLTTLLDSGGFEEIELVHVSSLRYRAVSP